MRSFKQPPRRESRTESLKMIGRPHENKAGEFWQPLELAELLASVAISISAPTPSQAKLLGQLNHLRDRLSTERFQLAVLGQFKRGKSTLLNALLRADLLPTGVVPVTALPTFLEDGKILRLRVTYAASAVEEVELSGQEMAQEALRALVTEDANPKNTLGIARVEVSLPSEFLARGVVLIDTPGVGSTFHHNTTAADAILPECDAALFVVSPDPPITELEIEFLARIRKTAAHLIILLNKIDALEPEERGIASGFLRRVLADQAGLGAETPIFCVSARSAIRAREKGDAEAFAASGFVELETYLAQFLANEKRATLSAAIARKAAALIGELQLETEISLRALHLPLEGLKQRMAAFDEAAKRFEAERRTAADVLAGDRLRVLQKLEAHAERLRAEGRVLLEGELDRTLASGASASAAKDAVTSATFTFFDAALKEVVQDVGEQLAAMFRVHQSRADELITEVRQTAADLLEIPFRGQDSREAFEPKRDPFWVTSAGTVTLSPISPDVIDRLLPSAMRRKRLRRRLLDEIDSLLMRNVENLRWATRQNLEDAFRKFAEELDERLAMSLVATQGAMKAAFDRRSQHSASVETEIANKKEASLRLSRIADALSRCE